MVTTIHQPNSMIAALFDDLLLLSHGRVVYHGGASRAVDHFNTHKFWCGSPCNTVILPVVLHVQPQGVWLVVGSLHILMLLGIYLACCGFVRWLPWQA